MLSYFLAARAHCQVYMEKVDDMQFMTLRFVGMSSAWNKHEKGLAFVAKTEIQTRSTEKQIRAVRRLIVRSTLEFQQKVTIT